MAMLHLVPSERTINAAIDYVPDSPPEEARNYWVAVESLAGRYRAWKAL
jgi:hypothetical protein